MVAHGGLSTGHAPAPYCFPQPPQAQCLHPPAPAPARRVTGTPKERAQAGERAFLRPAPSDKSEQGGGGRRRRGRAEPPDMDGVPKGAATGTG
jgi:hypothetical protein